MFGGRCSSVQVRSDMCSCLGSCSVNICSCSEAVQPEHLFVFGERCSGAELISTPRAPGTRNINDIIQKSIENRLILAEIAFQKHRVGRGFVLTKYEPVASCVDPV